MRDFLPEDVRRREYVIGVITRVYERYGFEPLETPAVENLETLMGKYGEEGNQLIFKILKRGEHEASGQADLALRYDLTVPLARVVAHHQSKLPRLFKRYQIQPVWRADRPARGRFREFYQCDVDALGSTSPVVEAELCAAVSDALTELGFSDFVDPLNHRQLLTSILERGGGCPRRCTVTALVASTSWTRSARTAWRRSSHSVASPRPRQRSAARSCSTRPADASRRARRVARLRRRRRPATRAVENLQAIIWRSTADERRGHGSASIRAWRAGCRITRARSWRSTSPTWPAASAAAAATTTWSACSSARASRPADSRSASSGSWS